jgi:hypothetical protein
MDTFPLIPAFAAIWVNLKEAVLRKHLLRKPEICRFITADDIAVISIYTLFEVRLCIGKEITREMTFHPSQMNHIT